MPKAESSAEYTVMACFRCNTSTLRHFNSGSDDDGGDGGSNFVPRSEVA